MISNPFYLLSNHEEQITKKEDAERLKTKLDVNAFNENLKFRIEHELLKRLEAFSFPIENLDRALCTRNAKGLRTLIATKTALEFQF